MEEIWKPIPGWEDIYEVSNQGRVKSLERIVETNSTNLCRTVRERIRKTQTKKDGYLSLTLKNGDKNSTVTVHVLVMLAFVGPRPLGLQICHNNGVPSDNRLSNLRYDTPLANQQDRRTHGRIHIGEKNPSSKITNEMVSLMFEMREADWKISNIARFLGISGTIVGNILTGRRWSHLGYTPLPFKVIRN